MAYPFQFAAKSRPHLLVYIHTALISVYLNKIKPNINKEKMQCGCCRTGTVPVQIEKTKLPIDKVGN